MRSSVVVALSAHTSLGEPARSCVATRMGVSCRVAAERVRPQTAGSRSAGPGRRGSRECPSFVKPQASGEGRVLPARRRG